MTKRNTARMLKGIKIGALVGIAVGIVLALSHVPDCPPLYRDCAAHAWGGITTYAMVGAVIGGIVVLITGSNKNVRT